MIQFAGPPALQEALRAMCLEYSDIFATSVRRLPAKEQSMVLDIDHSNWYNEAIRQKSNLLLNRPICVFKTVILGEPC